VSEPAESIQSRREFPEPGQFPKRRFDGIPGQQLPLELKEREWFVITLILSGYQDHDNSSPKSI